MRVIALVFCVLASVFPLTGTLQSKEFVDLELVLAVDISRSMDLDEQALQRSGYVAAFRDPALMKAIRNGPNGRIAVTYVEWAGLNSQIVRVPWQVIATREDALKFADALYQQPFSSAFFTSISGALELSRQLFSTSPVRGLRRVIDVSGDGPNNSGAPVELARDRVVDSGVVINGLAIELSDRVGPYTFFDLPDLDLYYQDCVIGGPGAFVLTIRSKQEFVPSIRKKLLLEIAGTPFAPAPRVWRAQAGRSKGKYDCLIGEKMWEQFRRNRPPALE
ncbi:MAG: DUF1194 domain-containing protein [Pseudomonadota bacterium]